MRAVRVMALAAGIVAMLAGVEAGKRMATVAPVRVGVSLPAQKREQAQAPLMASAQITALPLSFEANQGQTHASVRYLARGKGYSLLLSPTEANLLSTARISALASVRMRLLDANPAPVMTAENPLPGKVHYLVGSDPRKWHPNIPTSSRVRSHNVYPGIDLVYYGNQGHVEYDFIVAPGADPNRIRLEFDGAKNVTLDATGNLLLELPNGETLLQHKPVVYQETASGRKEIVGGYRFEGKNRVRFTLGEYDRSQPLVIDPVIQYSTFWGGDGIEGGQGLSDFDQSGQVAVDEDGAIYLTGITVISNPPQANALPVTRAFRVASPNQLNDREMYVTRLSPDGRQVQYSVIIGGESFDTPVDIAVRNREAYVLMATTSRSLPIVNPLRGPSNNRTLYYVFHLNRNGDGLLYGSFITGLNDDVFPERIRGGIAVNSANQIAVTGTTQEADFPTTRSAFQNRKDDGRDMFVALISPNKSGLAQLGYSTFVGGEGDDKANDMVLRGNIVHITGSTSSKKIKARSGRFGFGAQSFTIFQEENRGGTDAFVLCMNLSEKNRDSLAYFTYLGGAGTDVGNAITVNNEGEAFVTGLTGSFNFPIRDAVDRTNQVNEAFVIQLNLTGSFPIFSTFLGGNDRDTGEDIALDSAGNIWVVGTTTSTDPGSLVKAGAPQTTKAGVTDGFIVQLSVAGQRVLLGTLLGGIRDETNLRAVSAAQHIFVTGQTNSTNFPVSANAIRKTNPGTDSFLTVVGDLDACATRFPVVRITRSNASVNSDSGQTSIQLTLKTPANTPSLPNPVRVILFNLPQDVSLLNRNGSVNCPTTTLEPFINVPTGGDNRLTAGEEAKVTLRFSNSEKKPISFNAVVVAGPGTM